jgi:uncharacterized protein (DUF58 family)
VGSLLSGRHASRVRGRGLNFEEIRAYRPGDDIRTIDWRITNRLRQPHTRVFTEERDRPALVVVDQRLSMFYGTVRDMKSVTAAEAAALAAWRVFDQGDRVGALVFNDTDITEVRPHRSAARVMQVLEAVVTMNRLLRAETTARRNNAQLNAVLQRAAVLARHDFLVVVVSDFDGADDETRRLVVRMKQHNDVICCLVHDPSATEIPAPESFVVSDGELQAELDLARDRVRKRVHEYSSGRIADILGWQSRYGIPVLPLTTAGDVPGQVRRLLGALQGGARKQQ